MNGVLARWRALFGLPLEKIGPGLINDTWLVHGRAGDVVVQRLNPLWTPAVCEDIEAVTSHLARRGLVTPRIVPCDDGERCAVDDEGRVWRALSYVPGTRTFERLESARHAAAAGELVGRVHVALDDLAHEYRFTRAFVHDTAKHLASLRAALDDERGHRLYDEAAPLAHEILAEAAALPSLGALPRRHAHGDLKVSNLLFDDEGKGVCLVDLDTLARMIWPHEMGDALRSWCNPGGEDQGEVRFDLALFEAAVMGYAAGAPGLISREERELLVAGLMTIALELAARFAADALYERYFGFDQARYSTRGEHNLVRARGQWRLYESVKAQRGEAERIAARALV